MTVGSQRLALDAIDSARPIVARLSMDRHSEDLAADIIEAWGATETGLRSLVGGSSLTGQMLIRELRQRHFLSLEQANALAEFHAAQDRAARVDYKPTEGDVNASRDAFLKLEAGLMGEQVAGGTASSPAARSTAGAMAATAAALASHPLGRPSDPNGRERFEGAAQAVPRERVRPTWFAPILGAAALLLVVLVVWFALRGRGGSSASLASGVTAFREGRREAAQGEFAKAAKDDPKDPMPHVYLARIARDQGNLNTATQEVTAAMTLAPQNAAANREFASLMFARQNYDMARKYFAVAVKLDPSDRLAQGFLACSLARLGRVTESRKWFEHAGPGAWSSCAPQEGSGQPGMQQVPASGTLPLAPGAQSPR